MTTRHYRDREKRPCPFCGQGYDLSAMPQHQPRCIDNDDFTGDPSAVVLVDLPCRRCGALVQIDADVLEETQNQNVECPIWCEQKGA